MEAGSSAPLSSADKPGQQLCETLLQYWLEPFESSSACESAWVRRGRRNWVCLQPGNVG